MQLEDDLVQRLVFTSTLEQTDGTQIWDGTLWPISTLNALTMSHLIDATMINFG